MSLDIGGININDDTVISLVISLAANKRLSNLILNGREITDRIWGAFTDILCDNSSVQSTYHSNHTLHTLKVPGFFDVDVSLLVDVEVAYLVDVDVA